MLAKIKNIRKMAQNMGWKYIRFRAKYELMQKYGMMKKKFPAAPEFKQYITLQQWKDKGGKFFFADKESLTIIKKTDAQLKERFEQIKEGKLLLFNSTLANLGNNYDWNTNPDSGFHYDNKKHWTQIADLSPEAGDIKYVWEKSRFSYLYDIIRYDYHYTQDCGEMVFRDILSWIDNNPVNCGPNYRCSQEISLRLLNWTFALHYYKNSAALTDAVFSRIQYAMYWQIEHVHKNLDFSKIAVRNNHAITESLALYLIGTLFPDFPNAATWEKEGKASFETEITYQVYKDGTYLQFSMNYHRVVVQLLTWAITLAEKNNDKFVPEVYDRARKSVQFLRTCMVEENGYLPNYGANDGALFFKLSEADYRDYRPQIQALARALNMEAGLNIAYEDLEWYGVPAEAEDDWKPANGAHSFIEGGYFVIREPETLTFIRCGKHKDRPSQADNLHLDIWYKGENILLDAGSYKYNTDAETMRYFSGTASHNTVMLNGQDQMQKGGRFIWYNWSQAISSSLYGNMTSYVFDGSVKVFEHIKEGIVHKRIVTKQKDVPVWEIKDELMNLPKDATIKQLWHVPVAMVDRISITAKDRTKKIDAQIQEGWSSSLYGQKEVVKEYVFATDTNYIETSIKPIAE